MYRPTQSDSAPIWQAYVEAGTTKDERNRRLQAAPEGMKERIRGHVMTAWLHQQKREKKPTLKGAL